MKRFTITALLVELLLVKGAQSLRVAVYTSCGGDLWHASSGPF
jgi:hypothetical protein